MGEVYRARDPRLGRDVAVKILPETFSQDPARLARFDREARALAALSHPGIAGIYGIEEADSGRFLVLELVEGETLAARLSRGPLPVKEALSVCGQIAEALEVAHEKGLIHRDLKPGNVMVTPDEKVKLLDFGLAKGIEGEPSDSDPESPTLPKPPTAEGVILGTAAYMSPEQARAKPLDKRTDIWSFGCVLYEVLTGRRAFGAESVSDSLAAVLDREPDWGALPPATPTLVRLLLKRCLRKDKAKRLHDIADAGIELEEALSEPGAPSSRAPLEAAAPEHRRNAYWATGSLLAGAALVALAGYWLGASRDSGGSQSVPVPAPLTHTIIDLPPEAPPVVGGVVPHVGFDSPAIALSPDGSQLVYVGESGEGTQLYLRAMDGLEVTPIPGTEDAIHPFFSPDGRWVGFLTNDQVKKVSLQGGAPLTLCNAQAWPVRASWTRDDMIYFADLAGTALARVPAGGGEPAPVADWLPKGGGQWLRRFADVLPDGKSALVTEMFRGSISSDHADILLLSLETLEMRVLVESGYDARYVSSGHLLFARSGNLLAVPFDLEQLEVTGEPVPVVSGVSMESLVAQAQVAVSDSGTLVYIPGGDRSVGKLAWVDREGDTEFLPVPERVYNVFDLAPGGRRLAVHIGDVTDYIWIYDIGRQEGRRLTAPGAAGYPEWTPDGSAVAFSSWRPDDVWRILVRGVDGPDEMRELFTSAGMTGYVSWSPDGRVLAIYDGGRWGVLATDGPPELTWLQPEGPVQLPRFSPDGGWVAYGSTETGRSEVWVRSYPDGDTVRQISVEGGIEPVWCDECGELFYRKGNQWMSSTVTLEPELTWNPPRLVFETDFVDSNGRSYDVSPDGQRLLVVKRTREPTRTKLHVLHNWFEELERRVPTR